MNPKEFKEYTEKIVNNVNQVIVGKDDVIRQIVICFIAGGHVLLEDIPGVGKTTLAMTVAKAVDLSYKRVQFTPDVLPSDLVGFSMYNNVTREFEYRPGAIFANLFLADEINRTSSKTQSALLELMEEGARTPLTFALTDTLPSKVAFPNSWVSIDGKS